jgi:CRP-like cAMP-binding protein
MKEVTFSKDQIIFRQGDRAEVMYDILSGKVGIYMEYKTENEKEIAVLGAGQTFGEMGMIEYYPRSATAVALEDTVLDEFGENELKEYFKDKPEKLLQLMKLLSQRIRETTQKYVDVCCTVSKHEEAENAHDAEEKAKRWKDMERYAKDYDNSKV